jgi:PhzF family phenazine biosynthesis protein
MSFLPFKQVDVFTRRPFFGNPVAVVLGAEALTPGSMQRIAAWTNLSETTFVLPPSSDQADYRLRIFTPKQELPFAGHPTIGSAHAVIESGYAPLKNAQLRQECLAGIVRLFVEESAAGKQIFVQAPHPKITTLDREFNASLMAALGALPGIAPEALSIDIGVVWIVVELRDAAAVATLEPDMPAVATLSQSVNSTGVTVFGRATDSTAPFHVRSFAPALGVPEDPVCGSGNAAVAACLLHRGELNAIGSRYIARQGMQVGRDGQVTVHVDGESIRIGGYSMTCVDGRLRID